MLAVYLNSRLAFELMKNASSNSYIIDINPAHPHLASPTPDFAPFKVTFTPGTKLLNAFFEFTWSDEPSPLVTSYSELHNNLIAYNREIYTKYRISEIIVEINTKLGSQLKVIDAGYAIFSVTTDTLPLKAQHMITNILNSKLLETDKFIVQHWSESPTYSDTYMASVAGKI